MGEVVEGLVGWGGGDAGVVEVLGVEVFGEVGGLGPESPGDAGGGLVVLVAVVGEGVLEGVGGGVVGLGGVAEGGGDAAVEEVVGEVGVVLGGLVEVPGGAGFGGEGGGELVGVMVWVGVSLVVPAVWMMVVSGCWGGMVVRRLVMWVGLLVSQVVVVMVVPCCAARV